MTSPSGQFRVVSMIASEITQFIVGLCFLIGGGFFAIRQLNHEPHDKPTLYICLGAAVFGALIMPGILPVAQKIVVLVFPNGIPLIGGQRKTDPPAPTPPASGKDDPS